MTMKFGEAVSETEEWRSASDVIKVDYDFTNIQQPAIIFLKLVIIIIFNNKLCICI